MVVSSSSMPPRGKPRSGLPVTIGARLMDSTPPARTRSPSSERTARAAWLTASRPDAHSRFTVAAGTSTGKPASSAAMRATLRLSSPAWLASPSSTSSTSAGSMPMRRAASPTTVAARSSGRMVDSAPA